jgi:lipopolysaccharide transport periplasmic protein LptA
MPLKIKVLLLSCITLWASNIGAQQGEAIRIVADQAERFELKGLTQYRGKVILTQGAITDMADELDIVQSEEGSAEIRAIGTPASFQQPANESEPQIDATAQTISYREGARIVILENNAKIQRGDSVVSGPLIQYFVDEKRVQAGTADDSSSERVEVVIPSQTEVP